MKKLLRILLVLCLALAPAGTAYGQYYSAGQDPWSTRWSKLDFTNYSIIYPQGADSLARRYLLQLETTRRLSAPSYRDSSKKITVVMHTDAIGQTTTVGWTPRRIELFTTPVPTGGIPIEHSYQTALRANHLLGYMSQYDSGIYRFLQYPFGQQSIILGPGFWPGLWQATGNAASHITDVTGSGPGRSGEYLMFYRAAFLNHDFRTFEQWRFGSYRNYSPPREVFGYLVINNMRFFSGNYASMGDVQQRQNEIWWDLFGSWNKSFLDVSHKTVRKHWRFIQAYNTTVWGDDYIRRMPYTPITRLLQKDEPLYTEFRDVIPTGNGVLATRSGVQHTRALVSIDSAGKLRRMAHFSQQTGPLKKSGSKLYWSEVVPDARWSLRQYSIIRRMDLESGRTKSLTRRTRLFNPLPDDAGGRLFTTEYALDGGCSIVVLDPDTGDETGRAETPLKGQVTEMAIFGERLYALCITDSGIGLYSACTDSVAVSGNSFAQPLWQTEIPPAGGNMQHLSSADEGLLFVSDCDGVCNPYSFDPRTNEIKRLSNARFGAFYPTLDSTGLYMADYDIGGYHPVKVATGDLDWKPAGELFTGTGAASAYPAADRMAAQARQHLRGMTETEEALLERSIGALESKPYRKATHLFNIHSWAPLYVYLDRLSSITPETVLDMVAPGATLISQNTLGTAVSLFGYAWHNGRHTGHFMFNYSGLYPAFELSVDYNERVVTEKNIPSLDARLRVYVPWKFTLGGWRTSFVPEVEYTFRNDGNLDMTGGLHFYRVLEKTKRQLSPHLGFGIEARERRAVERDGSNRAVWLRGYGYLPGFTPDQGLKLSFGIQKMLRNSPHRKLENLGRAPRGYSKADFDNLDYFVASFDYGIFAWLNDLCVPWLFYLKRLQVIPFADYAMSFTDKTNHYLSFGADVLLGAHFFRIGSEINVGVRYARMNNGQNYVGVVFNNSL